MKISPYLILVFLLYSITSCAKTKLTEGINTVKDQKIKVMRSTMAFNDKKPWFIFPEKNKYKGPIPSARDGYMFPMRKKDIHVDLVKVNAIIYGVLKEKKQTLHNKNEKLGVSFIFETNGMLTVVSYSLSEGTIISLAEIEQIDTILRQEIKATFTGPDYAHYTAVNYTFPSVSF